MVTMNSEADKTQSSTQATNALAMSSAPKTPTATETETATPTPSPEAASEAAAGLTDNSPASISTVTATPASAANGSNNGPATAAATSAATSTAAATATTTVIATTSAAAAAAAALSASASESACAPLATTEAEPEQPDSGNANSSSEPTSTTITVSVAATVSSGGGGGSGSSCSSSHNCITTVAAATPPLSSKTVSIRDATAPSCSGTSAPKSSGLLSVGSNHHHHHHHSSPSSSQSQSQSPSPSQSPSQSQSQSAQPQPPPAPSVPQQPHQHQRGNKNEDAPNILVYKKMEAIIEKMQAETGGVAVRTVKAFMSKVPSVFTGADLVAWILKNFDVEDVTEALHFAHLLSSHGYIFPIDDHALTVKNDGTFYRFQTPYFWPSNCWEPENTDYAVYLCKRTMQNKTRLELADYEAENLAKLQKMFSRKWEFIFMQAESQSKVAKKRDKLERKVLDSQERAFWDVHRPMPGCVNTTEIDIKKAYRRGGSSHGTGSAGASVAKNPVEQLTRIITLRKQKLERRTIKVSKAAEALVAYYDQYNEFDYFLTSPELPNPWQTDSTEMWDTEKNSKDVPVRRVKRWAFSLRELLNDAIGRDQFTKFLEKEYSGENLKFWESVQEMKALPQSEIKEAIHKIWQEFLAPDAPCPVNVDSKSVELAREAVNSPNGPNRWCFDVAASHVYHLMKSDSYSRYLRSDMYKDYVNCSRKKIKSIPNLFGVKR
ncbi:regulator of G-protein signaling 7 isoform X2 [Drosophila virilis]|uniref:regulator of G-protein signaling 7 isoform X2 n=1 Tax=Drosophila virilis TaxID=7244 RepID=UPI001395F27D|nr:regulator of G-protein signaling 7 isoform X2 [Drosophila virilis]